MSVCAGETAVSATIASTGDRGSVDHAATTSPFNVEDTEQHVFPLELVHRALSHHADLGTDLRECCR
jgi:hypothetical protein